MQDETKEYGWFTYVYAPRAMTTTPEGLIVATLDIEDPRVIKSRCYYHYPHRYTVNEWFDEDKDEWIPEHTYSYTKQDILEQAIDSAKSWYYHAQSAPGRDAVVVDHNNRVWAVVEYIQRVRMASADLSREWILKRS